ncbi:tryptophanase [Acidobacteriota bacterium]
MTDSKIPVEPYRIKMVESLRRTTREEREAALQLAGFNIFNIPADMVFIDLLTDSGTSAMSDRQWAGMIVGDESYAGAKSFFRLEKTIKNIFGFEHVIPTHQGRAAERILFQTMVKKRDSVPNNIHFDTTRANIAVLKAFPLNFVVDSAYDVSSDEPFKGNMDVDKLRAFIQNNGTENIPLVMLTVTNNSAAGQPVSMENIKKVSALCREYNLPLILDACRFAENSYFIKTREEGFAGKTLLEIAQEMFSYADGATMSAKKDALVNIGGFITLNDNALAHRIKNNLIVGEGFPTYGGLAGRDLEAVSQGLEEVLEEDYMEHRIAQVRYFGELLDKAGIPVYKPIGGHAVYILADKFLSHLPREQFPGWALTVALYRHAGVRGVEIGGVMFAKKDEKSGKEKFPKLEMVRLSIPRRVYTLSHIGYVVDALTEIYQKKGDIRGLRIIEQEPPLRHFTARLEEI